MITAPPRGTMRTYNWMIVIKEDFSHETTMKIPHGLYTSHMCTSHVIPHGWTVACSDPFLKKKKKQKTSTGLPVVHWAGGEKWSKHVTPSMGSLVRSPKQHHRSAEARFVSHQPSGRLGSLSIHLQPAVASSAWSLVPLPELAGCDGRLQTMFLRETLHTWPASLIPPPERARRNTEPDWCGEINLLGQMRKKTPRCCYRGENIFIPPAVTMGGDKKNKKNLWILQLQRMMQDLSPAPLII